MRIVPLLFPSDLGKSDRGRYQESGIRGAPDLLIDMLHDEGVRTRRPITINVPQPEADDAEDSPLKFDALHAAAAMELAKVVEEVNAEADFPLILGGDHTAMMGHVLGHSLRHERGIGLAVLASAHTGLLRPGTPAYGDKAKLRSDAQATPTGDAHRMTMAAALRRIPESFVLGEAMKKSAVKADRTSVVGVRAPSTAQIRAAEQATGIDVWSMERLEFDGEQPYRSMLTRSLAAGPIALSIDVGGLDPDLMAAVSDPIPDGLDWSFLKRSLEQAVPHIDRVLGLDICELDPHRDIAQSRGMTRFIEAIAPFLRKISR